MMVHMSASCAVPHSALIQSLSSIAIFGRNYQPVSLVVLFTWDLGLSGGE